jgi:GMP synthase (glutamine-hydrolysing)
MIVILDFGSQYTQLIARRVREANVFCEIHPFNYPAEKIRTLDPKGIILSGGPASVYAHNAPLPDPKIFDLGVPMLGICYGLQVMVTHFGGKVSRAARREYGPADIQTGTDNPLFQGLGERIPVWMSHGDHAERVPTVFPSWPKRPTRRAWPFITKNGTFLPFSFIRKFTTRPRVKRFWPTFCFGSAARSPIGP